MKDIFYQEKNLKTLKERMESKRFYSGLKKLIEKGETRKWLI
jgi:hypothetical protein